MTAVSENALLIIITWLSCRISTAVSDSVKSYMTYITLYCVTPKPNLSKKFTLYTYHSCTFKFLGGIQDFFRAGHQIRDFFTQQCVLNCLNHSKLGIYTPICIWDFFQRLESDPYWKIWMWNTGSNRYLVFSKDIIKK